VRHDVCFSCHTVLIGQMLPLCAYCTPKYGRM
jgi:hypothetical protein